MMTTYLMMVLFIKVSGKVRIDMVREHKFGLMELNTKADGGTIKQTDMVNSTMLMEMYMKVSGKMIRPMEREYTNI